MDFQPLKNFMELWAEEFTPGCCAVVFKDGKEVFRHSAGYSDLDKKVKLNGGELFNLYSCSKVTTVVAALQLYEKGAFLLDDPLYEYIPEFRDMTFTDNEGNIHRATNTITLRRLFTMTAGFTYDVGDVPERAKSADGKIYTLDFIRELAKEPLAFEPGMHWKYSRCHDVLAGVVEVISGQRFRDYVKENIFEPLGMYNSFYHLPDEKRKDMAHQYFFEAKGAGTNDIVKLQMSRLTGEGVIREIPLETRMNFGDEYDDGGGGVISTADDYIKLVAALANNGTGINGEKILSSGAVELLHTNQLNDSQLKDFTWPDLKGYGYGLGVRTMMNRSVSGSLGSFGEFGWSGAAGSTTLADTECNLALMFTQHIVNPRESYYSPRLRNILYSCIK